MWDIEYTNEFGQWWNALSEDEQVSIAKHVGVLAQHGPNQGRPLVDTIKSSRHANMKELRVQHGGKPFRVFFAFDPRRAAILLIGGNKGGDKRFYDRMVPVADRLYDEHLEELREGGEI